MARSDHIVARDRRIDDVVCHVRVPRAENPPDAPSEKPQTRIGDLERAVQYAGENGADPDRELRRTAAELNERIRLNLRRRPELQEKYERVTGRRYRDDWWREHHAAL